MRISDWSSDVCSSDLFQRGAALVAALVQQSNDRHNEVVLMAGSLGLSQLVCMMNNAQGETSASLLGPFWRMHSPPVANGESIIRTETEGDPFFMTGRVVDTSGRPIAGAEIDIWHSSPGGHYENEDESQANINLLATLKPYPYGIVPFRILLPT